MIPKQVIVVNKSLNMPLGKLSAQVAHASLGAILMNSNRTNTSINIEYDEPLKEWLNGKFTKIVLYVKSEEKLLDVYQKAKDKGLRCSLIKDAGDTFFKNPTYTCVGIGPVYPDELDGITDKLRLY